MRVFNAALSLARYTLTVLRSPPMPVAQQSPAGEVEAAAMRWVRRKLGAADHERRVLAVAGKLFDLTRSLLNLTDADAELLRLAAITHDVGRCVSDKDHPTVGASLIKDTSSFPMSPAVRRRLAFLARYHRGAVPTAAKQDYLLPADARGPVMAVLALLRAADALDHRPHPAERLVLSISGRRLNVRCVVTDDVAAARRVYTRRKKFRLLDDLLGHPVQVTVEADV